MKSKKLLKIVLLSLLGIIMIIPIIALSFRNVIIRGQIERYCERLGMPVDIENFEIGLFQSRIKISGLRIYNPGGGREELFLDAPLVYIDFEASPALRGKLHCSDVEIDIQEIVITKDRRGSNIERFYEAFSASGEKMPDDRERKPIEGKLPKQVRYDSGREKSPKAQKDIKIKKLVLTIDHIKIKGLGKGECYITLGIDHEEFNDLDGAEQIASVVGERILDKAGLRGLGALLESSSGGEIKNIKEQFDVIFGN